MIRIVGAVLVVSVSAALVYGYWFGRTHGALSITVLDVSDREHSKDVKRVDLSFQDPSGTVLAEAEGAEDFGAITVSSPSTYSCRDLERRAATVTQEEWAPCFERQSRWLPTWVRDVKSVDIRVDSCSIHRFPIIVSEHPDTWWLWWVPLRHIGGKPYTSFSFLILFSRASCEGQRTDVPGTGAAQTIDKEKLKGAWWIEGEPSFTWLVMDRTILMEFDMKEPPYRLEGNVLVIDSGDPAVSAQRTRILRLTDEELEIQDEQAGAKEILRKR